MKKILLPVMTLAMLLLPAAANAAQCRDTGTGKFAKCGSPGAVLASNYVAKGKTSKSASKTMAHTMGTPAAAPARPGFMSMLKPRAKPAVATAAALPVTKPAKGVRCKSATGKFVKCGTPGAITI